MMASDDDRTRRARALFDAEVQALDGATTTALRARRRDALASTARPRHAAWWWPASGIATAALAVVLWLPRSEAPMPETAPPPEALADASAATEAARFADAALAELDDDAAFYAWLATVPDDAGRPPETPALSGTGPNQGLTL